MKIATGNSKRKGKKKRTPCPVCKAAYLQGAYVLIHDQKKRTWKEIGKYCNVCGHFSQLKERKDENDVGQMR